MYIYQNITFKSYLSKFLVIVALFVFLPMVLSPFAKDTTSSFIISCVCFFIITLVGVKIILGENRYVKFYAIAFIIHIILGLAHYLYFVDPSYFQTDGSGSHRFYHEYLSVFDALDRLQNARKDFGIFYTMDPREFEIAHPQIWHICSYPFYFLQNKWLNYAPLNIFSSLSTSCNIILFYKLNYKFREDVHKLLLFWTAYFPTFLLADLLWRDPFGIYLISLGIVLVSISNTFSSKVLSFAFFATASFMQRTMYIILAGVSTFWGKIVKTKSPFVKILYAAIGIVAVYYLGNIADSSNAKEYNSMYVNTMSYIALPIKIVFGMIGPFPWTNFFKSLGTDPAYSWQLQDYLMGTFQFGYLIAILVKWKFISFKGLDSMTIMGFCIMISGFVTIMMHIGYISEGLLLTLPWFFSQISTEYRKYLFFSFVVLLFLNVFIALFGHIGISNLWGN